MSRGICRFDVRLKDVPVVGCSPDDEASEYWADHFHAKIDGKPCAHRHRSWQTAVGAHRLAWRERKIA